MRLHRTVVVFLLSFALVLTAAGPALAAGFTDVGTDHPYRDAILDLAEREVIEGYDDGTFRPGEPVWRQHFAKMIVLALGLPCYESDVCPFGDVTQGGSTTYYPDNFIAVAAEQGITKGIGGDTFGPYQDISRAQVITMVVRAVDKLSPGTLSTPPGSYTGTWGNFSSTHAANAKKAEYNGLLLGLPLSGLDPLDPWGSMPRGEVAQVLANLMDLEASDPGGPVQRWRESDMTLDDVRAHLESRVHGGYEVLVPSVLPSGWKVADGNQPFDQVDYLVPMGDGYWETAKNPAVYDDEYSVIYSLIFTDGVNLIQLVGNVVGDWGETYFSRIVRNGVEVNVTEDLGGYVVAAPEAYQDPYIGWLAHVFGDTGCRNEVVDIASRLQ